MMRLLQALLTGIWVSLIVFGALVAGDLLLLLATAMPWQTAVAAGVGALAAALRFGSTRPTALDPALHKLADAYARAAVDESKAKAHADTDWGVVLDKVERDDTLARADTVPDTRPRRCAECGLTLAADEPQCVRCSSDRRLGSD